MSDARHNVVVGAFVMLGMLLLGVLVVWFGEEPDWLKRVAGGGVYPLHVSFAELSGVETGAEVRMAVGTVGRVTGIRFRNPQRPGEGIDVTVEIRDDVEIPSNAVAVVEPGTMFAHTSIVLNYPRETAQPVAKDGTGMIIGRVAGMLDNVIPPGLLVELEKAVAAIGNLADGLTPVARDMHLLFERRPTAWVDHPPTGMADISANITTAVERLDQTLKHFNTVLGDPETQSQVKEAVTNFRQMSQDGQAAMTQFREFSGEMREIGEQARRVLARIETTFENADSNVADLTGQLATVADQLSSLLTHLDQAARSLVDGKGSAALMLNDNRLYEEMVITFRRLTAAAEDLQNLIKEVQESGLRTRLN